VACGGAKMKEEFLEKVWKQSDENEEKEKVY